MNRAEIERLAAAVVKLRPDWVYVSIVTFLERTAADMPLWDAARKLVWIATEPGLQPGEFANETPRLFTESGPWATALIPISSDDAPTPVPIGWCSLHRCEDSTRNPCPHCRIDRANALTDQAKIAQIRAAARQQTDTSDTETDTTEEATADAE